jgi:uncharacterized membrane protein
MPMIIILFASALAAAAPSQPGPAGLPLPLNCYGGEPFWSLTLHDATRASFKSDIDDATWTIESIGNAMLRPTTWRVTFKGKNRAAFIFDEGQKACSDSDGDRPLAYGLLVEDGDGFLRGCCDPKQ